MLFELNITADSARLITGLDIIFTSWLAMDRRIDYYRLSLLMPNFFIDVVA